MNDLSDVKYRMEEEGFDYCFRHYAKFEEIKDPEFHKLRLAYIEAANALEKYVDKNSPEEDEDEE